MQNSKTISLTQLVRQNLALVGWGTGTRTPIACAKGTRPTIRRSPNVFNNCKDTRKIQ